MYAVSPSKAATAPGKQRQVLFEGFKPKLIAVSPGIISE